MGDWLDDLGEFSASVVAGACQEWRRTSDKRPTIAGIRRLCAESRPYAPPRPSTLPPYDPIALERQRAVMSRKYADAAAHRDAWAREHGCESFGAAMQIGLAIVARRGSA